MMVLVVVVVVVEVVEVVVEHRAGVSEWLRVGIALLMFGPSGLGTGISTSIRGYIGKDKVFAKGDGRHWKAGTALARHWLSDNRNASVSLEKRSNAKSIDTSSTFVVYSELKWLV